MPLLQSGPRLSSVLWVTVSINLNTGASQKLEDHLTINQPVWEYYCKAIHKLYYPLSLEGHSSDSLTCDPQPTPDIWSPEPSEVAGVKATTGLKWRSLTVLTKVRELECKWVFGVLLAALFLILWPDQYYGLNTAQNTINLPLSPAWTF